jgi:hypothetical protein
VNIIIQCSNSLATLLILLSCTVYQSAGPLHARSITKPSLILSVTKSDYHACSQLQCILQGKILVRKRHTFITQLQPNRLEAEIISYCEQPLCHKSDRCKPSSDNPASAAQERSRLLLPSDGQKRPHLLDWLPQTSWLSLLASHQSLLSQCWTLYNSMPIIITLLLFSDTPQD